MTDRVTNIEPFFGTILNTVTNDVTMRDLAKAYYKLGLIWSIKF